MIVQKTIQAGPCCCKESARTHEAQECTRHCFSSGSWRIALCDPYLAELFLVRASRREGQPRVDRRYQAIMPLRGKPINAEKARLDKLLSNEQIQSIITALGTGIGEDFDISKLRYRKVVIMTDADVDGAHIRTLLLTFFYRFTRELIERGNIYIAQPPFSR